ncbi:MAG: DciA family protein [bacterium]|nr:DciA family protein [bacterium]
MFNSLSNILSSKFKRKDDLSRQIEIAKVLDLCREEFRYLFPSEEINVVSLKNKALLVELDNSVLASELRMRETRIISKINGQIGNEVIKKIIYRF